LLRAPGIVDAMQVGGWKKRVAGYKFWVFFRKGVPDEPSDPPERVYRKAGGSVVSVVRIGPEGVEVGVHGVEKPEAANRDDAGGRFVWGQAGDRPGAGTLQAG